MFLKLSLKDFQEIEWLNLVLDLYGLIILIDWLMKLYHAQWCAINEAVLLLWNGELAAFPSGSWPRIGLPLPEMET